MMFFYFCADTDKYMACLLGLSRTAVEKIEGQDTTVQIFNQGYTCTID